MIAAIWTAAVLLTAPTRVLTNTDDVRSVAVTGTEVWVGTAGGVERYDGGSPPSSAMRLSSARLSAGSCGSTSAR